MIAALEANGVDLVFGIPGTHNLELYRGLSRSPITHVAPRHEQGAGYAADGYARATGRPGVVITTSGPGLLNAFTALGTAHADSVPLLVLSPGAPTGRERADYGWLHEVKDQRAAADAVVARSVRCGTPQAAVAAVCETFARWAVERPRPVHIEIPLDVLEAAWEDGPVPAVQPCPPPTPSPGPLAEALDLLGRARSPVVVTGGGALDAAVPLRAVAELLDAPVVTTTAGKGVFDEDHPLSVGAFVGAAGARDLLESADVLLVVGSELGDAEVPDRLAPSGRVVRVDVEIGQLDKNLRADVRLHSAARPACEALLRGLAAGRSEDRGGSGKSRAAAARQRCLAGAREHGGRWEAIQHALRSRLPADTVVVGDSSQVSYLGTAPFWRFAEPRRFLLPTGFSTLGYGLPAAMGAKLADPRRPVVALLGDGAFMFSPQELLTAAELRLGLPVVVVDNHGFGEIRQNMLDRAIAPMAVDLARPDFPALARSLGCAGVRAADEAAAAREAVEALDRDRPTLVWLEAGP